VQVDAFITPELRQGFDAARPLLLRAAGFSVGVNLLMLTGPLYMLQLYDRVLASRSMATLAVLTLLIVGLFTAMGVLDFVRAALVARAAKRFDDGLRDRAFEAAVDAARLSGNVSGGPVKDLRTVRQALGSPAVAAFFDAPFAPFYVLLVFLLHWSLGALTILGAGALIALAVFNERLSRKALAHSLESATSSDANLSGVLRNAAAADAMGMRAVLKRNWERSLRGANLDSSATGDSMNSFAATIKAGRMLLQSLILGHGALLAINQEITAGVMIAASIIAARALAPVEQAIGQWRIVGAALAAWRRLGKTLAAAPARPEKLSLPTPTGHLRLERVYCQPGLAKKPTVKNVTFEARPGEAIGVVGPSGAGKSTLARAIVGVERVVSGQVRLDGADLLAWDREDAGRFIGYLPQEAELFDGTVAQNIARFDAKATDAEIVAAAQAAGAMGMILGLADGFETQIGERGTRLSVGQRQRIGLARALFRDPVLVVLDEPNANLDNEGDIALEGAVKALKERHATVILVAHRPSALTHVDKLLMLIDGEPRAFGPRDDVLNKIAPGRVAALGGRRAPEQDQNASGGRSNR
jgi:PrtD family type I secretion system ABC transporter